MRSPFPHPSVSLWLLVLVAGCSAPDLSRAAEIDASGLRRYDTTVVLDVQSHVEEDDPQFGALTASATELRGMLVEAIESHAIFEAVAEEAPYRLSILLRTSLVSVTASGASRVEVVTDWELLDAGERSLWKERIATHHECTIGEHFVGVARARAAAIGAYRANLERGFSALARSGALARE
jgi:hypothetical protein